MKINLKIALPLAIFLLAAFFRFYGVNWDQNQHLHPDERFLTMVTGAISWPKTLTEYLDASTSPLNPHNRGFGFFVYGTFPIFFTKLIAETIAKGDYFNLTIVGRQLSALFDLGTVVIVFLIGKQISTNQLISTNKYQPSINKSSKLLVNWKLDNWIIGLFAAYFYAAMVLPIQLSHFYAVDTYLTFFITLTFYLCTRIFTTYQNDLQPKYKILKSKYQIYKLSIIYLLYIIGIGISFGLSLASKISAVLFLPVVALGLLLYLVKRKNFIQFIVSCFLFLVFCLLTFRLAQPYAFANPSVLDFHINQNFIESLKTLKSFDGPETSFPPALQWIPTKAYIYPATHLTLWGMGLPFSLLFVASLVYLLINKKTYNNLTLLLSLLWIVLLFGYQGKEFAKALRYLAPLLPFACLITGYCLTKIFSSSKSKSIGRFGLLTVVLLCLIYPASFLTIYSKPHSRVWASNWIYENLPQGSKIAVEHWDDGLPLTLDGVRNNGLYTYITLPLYNPDGPEKWQQILPLINDSDYIILTSNRLWRSLSALPVRFPETARYYQALFNGTLGFKQLAVFSSYPCILPKKFDQKMINSEKTDLTPEPTTLTKTPYCHLALNDDGAEESFTVYDHPKVIIFEKTPKFSTSGVLNIVNTINN